MKGDDHRLPGHLREPDKLKLRRRKVVFHEPYLRL
jgi:hypothetical protein